MNIQETNCNQVAYIKLTKNQFAIVDLDDFDILNKFKWFASPTSTGRFYAARATVRDSNYKQTRIWMHRVIINAPENLKVDHIDGNGLNNRKSNLRFATIVQNGQNRLPNKGKKFKGVSFNKSQNSWLARIKYENSRKFLGYYKSQEDAAKAYDDAAIILYGEFANLNFKEGNINE